ncbi:MAG: hypothetical protein LQ350_007883 [Teloschistes chrysophthalmus]|nr:MAG: hypothetical protein LQ350_007883 [Niorma chrysophthalma]
MSNTNGAKRAWVPDEETQWTYKRVRVSFPQQQYNTGDMTRDHRQTPQRPSSPPSQPSEDSEDRELARLEAELAKRKQAREIRRDRERAKRSPMPPAQPSQQNTYASQKNYRSTEHNTYGLSQHNLGDDTLYGNTDTGYGSSVFRSSVQPVHGPQLANIAPSHRAAGHRPRPQPTITTPRRPEAVQTPRYLPGSIEDPITDPYFNSYGYDPLGIMGNQAYDPRFNAADQSFQSTSGLPNNQPQYLPQVTGPPAPAPGMQSTRLGPPFHPHGYPTQPNFPPSRKRGREYDKASPEEPLPKTKRQKRLARDVREGKERGSDNKEIGQIRFDEHENMLCCIDHEWLPAVYHHDRRERLLELAEQNGRLQYSKFSQPTSFLECNQANTLAAYDQVHGLDTHDRTAYHPGYKDINMKERNGRPRILYMWDPPAVRPKCEREPGYMVDPDNNNVILVDKNNHPIRNHKELPVVISGQVPGVWMELWRRMNPYITNADIVARTPNTTCLGIGKKYHALTQQAFNNRARRDRVLLGTRAWSEREGSEQIQAQLRAIMPARVLQELETRGTTAHWRDLTNEEITAVVSVNRGRGSALARAGARRLDERTKGQRDGVANARDEAVLGRLMKEKRREDEKDGFVGIQEVPARGVQQQNHAEEGSLSDSADEDESVSEDWSQLDSGQPTPSEIDATDAEQVNDATLVQSEFGEGDTLVQPADLDKDGNPVRHAGREEPGNDDQLDAAVGSETGYQYPSPPTAGGKSNVNPEPPINGNQWIGDGYLRPIDFSSLGHSTENTGANAVQVAGAVEEEPASPPPPYLRQEVDLTQQPSADASGASGAQSGDAIEEEPAPPRYDGNLDALQGLDTLGDSELDFSQYLSPEDEAAINAFLDLPHDGRSHENGGDVQTGDEEL